MPVYFDITDLLNFLRATDNVTGIQRVQMEAIRAVVASGDVSCCYFSKKQEWHQVSHGDFCALAEQLDDKASVWREPLLAFLDACQAAPQVSFGQGDQIYFFGATWNIPGIFESIKTGRDAGAICYFFLHDLIPVTHPEYFDDHHANAFTYWLANVLFSADGIICNSEETHDTFQRHVEFAGPVLVADLNIRPHFLAEGDSGGEPGASRVLAAHGLEANNYLLMVGTLEPRKNHLTAINAWNALRRERPDICPKLVFVGRPGWKYESILHHLETMNRDNRILWLTSVGDTELRSLLLNCKFSLYFSRCEGWGLPVTEALAAGKVCLVGDGSCAAGAAQDLLPRVDECSERSVTEAMRSLLDDSALLDSKEAAIRSQATFKTWETFLLEVRAIEAVASKAKRATYATVMPGKIYRFNLSQPAELSGSGSTGETLRRGTGWHPAEKWWTWVEERKSSIAFTMKKNGNYECYLYLRAPPNGASVSLLANGKVAWKGYMAGEKLLKASLRNVIAGAGVTLDLVSDRVQDMTQVEGNADNRQLGCAWRELMVVESDDLLGRIEAFEHFLSI